MKIVTSLVVGTLLLGAAAWAQTAEEFQGYMKSNNAAVTSLGKDLAGKSGDAAAMDAKTIEENMSKITIYFQLKNVSDAVKFAQQAKTGFSQVAILASAGKFDEASAAMKTAQANCAGCHMAHREKAADGSYKVK